MYIRLCKYTILVIHQPARSIIVQNDLARSRGDLRELEQYFKALADSTRFRILNLLLHGELCVCDIQHVLEAAQSTVSRHLAYLRNAGLVARSP